MKVIGKMIWQMVKEYYIIQMEMYIKEILKTIKLKDLEYISIIMVLSMKEIGKKIYLKGMENKYFLINHIIKDNFIRDYDKEEANINLLHVNIKDSGKIVNLMDLENIHDQIIELIKVNGKIIKCMEKEYINCKMVDNIKDNIYTIINMDMASINGQMVEYTKAIGKMENSME